MAPYSNTRLQSKRLTSTPPSPPTPPPCSHRIRRHVDNEHRRLRASIRERLEVRRMADHLLAIFEQDDSAVDGDGEGEGEVEVKSEESDDVEIKVESDDSPEVKIKLEETDDIVVKREQTDDDIHMTLEETDPGKIKVEQSDNSLDAEIKLEESDDIVVKQEEPDDDVQIKLEESDEGEIKVEEVEVMEWTAPHQERHFDHTHCMRNRCI